MVKKEKHQGAEEKILSAARKIFTTKGMAGARMQDIANEAGINKALLHYYYRDKEKTFRDNFFRGGTKILSKDQCYFSVRRPVVSEDRKICG
jgi:AcrR family transcriptional regulator